MKYGKECLNTIKISFMYIYQCINFVDVDK